MIWASVMITYSGDNNISLKNLLLLGLRRWHAPAMELWAVNQSSFPLCTWLHLCSKWRLWAVPLFGSSPLSLQPSDADLPSSVAWNPFSLLLRGQRAESAPWRFTLKVPRSLGASAPALMLLMDSEWIQGWWHSPEMWSSLEEPWCFFSLITSTQ